MEACSCHGGELCDRCVDASVAQLAGVAQNRGHYWAVELEKTISADVRHVPITASSSGLFAIALHKVLDLNSDRRVRERLATELVRAAARRWNDWNDADRRRTG